MSTAKLVMLVEDEKIIAMDVELTLQELGYEVMGSFDTVATALAGLATRRPDFALLDVTLKRNEISFPIAEELMAQGVPFVFLTGYTRATKTFPPPFDAIARLQKPITIDAIKKSLAASDG